MVDVRLDLCWPVQPSDALFGSHVVKAPAKVVGWLIEICRKRWSALTQKVEAMPVGRG